MRSARVQQWSSSDDSTSSSSSSEDSRYDIEDDDIHTWRDSRHVPTERRVQRLSLNKSLVPVQLQSSESSTAYGHTSLRSSYVFHKTRTPPSPRTENNRALWFSDWTAYKRYCEKRLRRKSLTRVRASTPRRRNPPRETSGRRSSNGDCRSPVHRLPTGTTKRVPQNINDQSALRTSSPELVNRRANRQSPVRPYSHGSSSRNNNARSSNYHSQSPIKTSSPRFKVRSKHNNSQFAQGSTRKRRSKMITHRRPKTTQKTPGKRELMLPKPRVTRIFLNQFPSSSSTSSSSGDSQRSSPGTATRTRTSLHTTRPRCRISSTTDMSCFCYSGSLRPTCEHCPNVRRTVMQNEVPTTDGLTTETRSQSTLPTKTSSGNRRAKRSYRKKIFTTGSSSRNTWSNTAAVIKRIQVKIRNRFTNSGNINQPNMSTETNEFPTRHIRPSTRSPDRVSPIRPNLAPPHHEFTVRNMRFRPPSRPCNKTTTTAAATTTLTTLPTLTSQLSDNSEFFSSSLGSTAEDRRLNSNAGHNSALPVPPSQVLTNAEDVYLEAVSNLNDFLNNDIETTTTYRNAVLNFSAFLDDISSAIDPPTQQDAQRAVDRAAAGNHLDATLPGMAGSATPLRSNINTSPAPNERPRHLRGNSNVSENFSSHRNTMPSSTVEQTPENLIQRGNQVIDLLSDVISRSDRLLHIHHDMQAMNSSENQSMRINTSNIPEGGLFTLTHHTHSVSSNDQPRSPALPPGPRTDITPPRDGGTHPLSNSNSLWSPPRNSLSLVSLLQMEMSQVELGITLEQQRQELAESNRLIDIVSALLMSGGSHVWSSVPVVPSPAREMPRSSASLREELIANEAQLDALERQFNRLLSDVDNDTASDLESESIGGARRRVPVPARRIRQVPVTAVAAPKARDARKTRGYSTQDVDALPIADLCKVCMNAPVECAILECGHLATCQECGDRLIKCPICRQPVYRVVRIYKS